jgi:hypothetical protein
VREKKEEKREIFQKKEDQRCMVFACITGAGSSSVPRSVPHKETADIKRGLCYISKGRKKKGEGEEAEHDKSMCAGFFSTHIFFYLFSLPFSLPPSLPPPLSLS